MPRNEIFALFGSIGSQRGENNEKKVYEAIQKLVNENCCPAWLTGYTSASKENDRHGIDGWFVTDVGKIPIQVKSSRSGKSSFKQRRSEIPVVVIHIGDTDEVVLQKCLRAIEAKRNEYLKLRER